MAKFSDKLPLLSRRIYFIDPTFPGGFRNSVASMCAAPFRRAECAPPGRADFDALDSVPFTESAWRVKRVALFNDVDGGFLVASASAFFQIEILAVFRRLGGLKRC